MAKNKKVLAVLCILIALSGYVTGQVVERTEITEDPNFLYDNAVVPLEGRGIIYIAGSDLKEKIRVDYYSTELEKLSSQTFITGPDVEYYDTEIYNDKAYSIFYSGWKYFGVLVTDLKTMKGEMISGKLPSKIYMQQFVVIAGNVFIRGLEGKNDVIMQFNLLTKKAKFIPVTVANYSRTKVIPQDLQVVNDELYLFINVEKKINNYDLFLMVGDKEGRFKAPVEISKNLPVKILSANADLINGKVMLAGTFTGKELYNPQGIFLGELNKSAIANMQTHYFQDMKSYYSLMPDRAKERFEAKKEKADKKNEKLDIKSSTLIHDIRKAQEGLFFMVEFYQLIRQKVSDNPPSYSTSYFTTHGMVVKFDENGSLAWDGAVKVSILASHPHKRLSGNETEDGGFVLACPGGDEVYLQNYDMTGNLLEEKTVNLEEDKSNADKNIKRTRSQVAYWYNHFFVVSGTQVVKDDKKKKVYFIDKISVDNAI